MLPILARRHGVQVTAEEQGRTFASAAQPTDHTGPTEFFTGYQVGKHAALLQALRHQLRRSGLIARRINTADAPQLWRQLHHALLIQRGQGSFSRLHTLPPGSVYRSPLSVLRPRF